MADNRLDFITQIKNKVWGGLGGNLSDQADLKSALDGKQPIDVDLTAIAGLTPANDDIIQRKSGAWVNRTISQLAEDLDLPDTNTRLASVSGSEDVGLLGYNPAQRFTPRSWALGATDGTGRDDFFRINDGSSGTPSMWSVYESCTPYTWDIVEPSILRLQSKRTTDSGPTHAVIRVATSYLGTSYYTSIIKPSGMVASARVGFVVMDAEMKKGAAIWTVFSESTGTMSLVAATYDSSSAWLTQANATTSNVAYTTDWTVRYTGDSISASIFNSLSMALQIIQLSSQTYFATIGLFTTSSILTIASFSFTPAYLCIFTEGNKGNRVTSRVDAIGREQFM